MTNGAGAQLQREIILRILVTSYCKATILIILFLQNFGLVGGRGSYGPSGSCLCGKFYIMLSRYVIAYLAEASMLLILAHYVGVYGSPFP